MGEKNIFTVSKLKGIIRSLKQYKTASREG